MTCSQCGRQCSGTICPDCEREQFWSQRDPDAIDEIRVCVDCNERKPPNRGAYDEPGIWRCNDCRGQTDAGENTDAGEAVTDGGTYPTYLDAVALLEAAEEQCESDRAVELIREARQLEIHDHDDDHQLRADGVRVCSECGEPATTRTDDGRLVCDDHDPSEDDPLLVTDGGVRRHGPAVARDGWVREQRLRIALSKSAASEALWEIPESRQTWTDLFLSALETDYPSWQWTLQQQSGLSEFGGGDSRVE